MDAPVNLLQHVPATVVVSSSVRNSSDRPGHLVDGDPTTAWSSRSGDLKGASITVLLPRDVQVTTIGLTSGFTEDRKGRDLFTQNYRVTAVKVTRDGLLLGRFPLSPQERGLQRIPVNQPGGYYQIEVDEVLPGSNARWREVCISELAVFGTTPVGAMGRPRRPTVRVESPVSPEFLADPVGRLDGPFASLAGFCRGWDEVVGAFLKDELGDSKGAILRRQAGEYLYPPSAPYCEPGPIKGSFAGAMLQGAAPPVYQAHVVDLSGQKGSYAALALLTLRGYYLYGVTFLDSYDNPHCSGSTNYETDGLLATAKQGSTRLVLRYREVDTAKQESGPDKVTVTRHRVACQISRAGTPTCRAER